jgi:hypothetical protein
MLRHKMIMLFALTAITTLSVFSTNASAQCRDTWITRAVQEITGRAVRGSGDSNECNKMNYGGGTWSTFEDLKSKVEVAGTCKDPLITQAYKDSAGLGRTPEGWGTKGECNPKLYNNGSWSSYNQLRDLIKEVKAALVLMAFRPEIVVIPGRNPATTSNALGITFISDGKIKPEVKLVGQDGGTLIGNDVAGLVGNDGAGVVPRGGEILKIAENAGTVAAGAGNAVWPSRVLNSTNVKNLPRGLKLKY